MFTINDLILALTDHTVPLMDQSISTTVIDPLRVIGWEFILLLYPVNTSTVMHMWAQPSNGAIAAIIDQSFPKQETSSI